MVERQLKYGALRGKLVDTSKNVEVCIKWNLIILKFTCEHEAQLRVAQKTTILRHFWKTYLKPEKSQNIQKPKKKQ